MEQLTLLTNKLINNYYIQKKRFKFKFFINIFFSILKKNNQIKGKEITSHDKKFNNMLFKNRTKLCKW